LALLIAKHDISHSAKLSSSVFQQAESLCDMASLAVLACSSGTWLQQWLYKAHLPPFLLFFNCLIQFAAQA